MAKKAPQKKAAKKAVKKKAPKKAAFKKKKALKKAAPALRNGWRVVCSQEGIIKRGLTKALAKCLSEEHEREFNHKTTYTNEQ